MPDQDDDLEGQSTEMVVARAKMSNALLNDPNTRGAFLRLLKKNNPNMVLPEIDTEDRVQEAVKPLKETIDKLQNERSVDSAQSAANAMFENLREANVVKTRKEFAELVKYASEKGFQQQSEQGLRLAAMHRDEENRPAEPTPQSAASAFFSKDKNKDLKDIMRDPTGWGRSKATEVVDEIIKNRGRAPA